MVYLFGELKGIQNIRESRQVEFLPYVLSSLKKVAGEDGFDPIKLNGGIDAKVGISSDYTLDLLFRAIGMARDFGITQQDHHIGCSQADR